MADEKVADEKTTRAIAAAGDIFLRYGFARTTMGDIANAAGMSRPALYLLFPGKEDIFTAATLHLATNRMSEIREAVAECHGLEARLSMGCTMLLGSVFALQAASPDAKDMDDFRFPVVRVIYQMFEDFFAAIISEANIAGSAPAQRIARVLLIGARGLRNVTVDAEDFDAMIRLHVRLICGGIGGSGPVNA